MVGNPLVLGEVADAIPRRYGGRTLVDLVLLLVPVVGATAAAVCLYWAVVWLCEYASLRRRRHAAARVAATRRRIAAVAAARQGKSG